MSSISIFPCSLTNGDKIVEELRTNLQLDLYTDRQLFEDTKKKFGVETEELEKLMYRKTSVFNKFTFHTRILKTIEVLESDTKYGDLLAGLIDAFHDSLSTKREKETIH